MYNQMNNSRFGGGPNNTPDNRGRQFEGPIQQQYLSQFGGGNQSYGGNFDSQRNNHARSLSQPRPDSFNERNSYSGDGRQFGAPFEEQAAQVNLQMQFGNKSAPSRSSRASRWETNQEEFRNESYQMQSRDQMEHQSRSQGRDRNSPPGRSRSPNTNWGSRDRYSPRPDQSRSPPRVAPWNMNKGISPPPRPNTSSRREQPNAGQQFGGGDLQDRPRANFTEDSWGDDRRPEFNAPLPNQRESDYRSAPVRSESAPRRDTSSDPYFQDRGSVRPAPWEQPRNQHEMFANQGPQFLGTPSNIAPQPQPWVNDLPMPLLQFGNEFDQNRFNPPIVPNIVVPQIGVPQLLMQPLMSAGNNFAPPPFQQPQTSFQRGTATTGGNRNTVPIGKHKSEMNLRDKVVEDVVDDMLSRFRPKIHPQTKLYSDVKAELKNTVLRRIDSIYGMSSDHEYTEVMAGYRKVHKPNGDWEMMKKLVQKCTAKKFKPNQKDKGSVFQQPENAAGSMKPSAPKNPSGGNDIENHPEDAVTQFYLIKDDKSTYTSDDITVLSNYLMAIVKKAYFENNLKLKIVLNGVTDLIYYEVVAKSIESNNWLLNHDFTEFNTKHFKVEVHLSNNKLESESKTDVIQENIYKLYLIKHDNSTYTFDDITVLTNYLMEIERNVFIENNLKPKIVLNGVNDLGIYEVIATNKESSNWLFNHDFTEFNIKHFKVGVHLDNYSNELESETNTNATEETLYKMYLSKCDKSTYTSDDITILSNYLMETLKNAYFENSFIPKILLIGVNDLGNCEVVAANIKSRNWLLSHDFTEFNIEYFKVDVQLSNNKLKSDAKTDSIEETVHKLYIIKDDKSAFTSDNIKILSNYLTEILKKNILKPKIVLKGVNDHGNYEVITANTESGYWLLNHDFTEFNKKHFVISINLSNNSDELDSETNTNTVKEAVYKFYFIKEDMSSFTAQDDIVLSNYLAQILKNAYKRTFYYSEDGFKEKHFEPKIILNGIYNSFNYEVVATNEESKNWLVNYDFNKFERCHFKIHLSTFDVYSYEKASIFISSNATFPLELLEKLKMQNKHLREVNFDKWILTKQITSMENGWMFFVGIDKSSCGALAQWDMSLNFELGKVIVVLRRKCEITFDSMYNKKSTSFDNLKSPNTLFEKIPITKNTIRMSVPSGFMSHKTANEIRLLILSKMYEHLANNYINISFLKYGISYTNVRVGLNDKELKLFFSLEPQNNVTIDWLMSLDLEVENSKVAIEKGLVFPKYIKVWVHLPNEKGKYGPSVLKKLESYNNLQGVNFKLWRVIAQKYYKEKSGSDVKFDVDLESMAALSKRKMGMKYAGKIIKCKHSEHKLLETYIKVKDEMKLEAGVADMEIDVDCNDDELQVTSSTTEDAVNPNDTDKSIEQIFTISKNLFNSWSQSATQSQQVSSQLRRGLEDMNSDDNGEDYIEEVNDNSSGSSVEEAEEVVIIDSDNEDNYIKNDLHRARLVRNEITKKNNQRHGPRKIPIKHKCRKS